MNGPPFEKFSSSCEEHTTKFTDYFDAWTCAQRVGSVGFIYDISAKGTKTTCNLRQNLSDMSDISNVVHLLYPTCDVSAKIENRAIDVKSAKASDNNSVPGRKTKSHNMDYICMKNSNNRTYMCYRMIRIK